MKNIPFVIWMLGYSVVMLLWNRVFPKHDPSVSDGVKLFASALDTFMWLYIGWLLYEK